MLFVDSFYLIAMINPRDAWRDRALSWARRIAEPLVTTEAVLIEVLDALCRGVLRTWAVAAIEDLRADPEVTCVATDAAIFRRAFELFGSRPDKRWSLTDCISFTVMDDLSIRRALTADLHFEQAGFTALLRG